MGDELPECAVTLFNIMLQAFTLENGVSNSDAFENTPGKIRLFLFLLGFYEHGKAIFFLADTIPPSRNMLNVYFLKNKGL